MYVIQAFGDLPIKAPTLFETMKAFGTFDAALKWLADNIVFDADEPYGGRAWIDPEDDRIVIWDAQADNTFRVVWHFSGWHWQFDASDLNGGPLDQGKLPGYDKSVYELATEN